MKQRLFTYLTLLMCLVMSGGINAWADAVSIPTTMGSYIATTNAVTTGTINKNDNGGFGYIEKNSTATFTLTNTTAQDMILTFMTGNSNSSNPKVKVDVTGTEYSYSKTVDVPNTGNWNFSSGTKHCINLGTLPTGTVTLKFTFTNESSYVCNLGNIAFYTISNYPAIGEYFDLKKGTYSTARTIDNAGSEGGKKVGYCSNGSSAAYDFYAGEQAYYNLCMAMAYSSGGTMNVKVTDYETGSTEVDQDITVDNALCKGYGNEVAMEIAAALNKGLKNIKLTFNTSGSWFMDYENVRITKRADVAARTLKNIKLDFTGNNSFIRLQETLAAAGCALWTAFATGIAVAADGTPSCVATDAANSVMTVNGKYHGTQYGVVPNSSFVVPVDGPAKFTYGTSAFSNDVTVTDKEDNQIAKLNINGSNYSSSATGNVVVGYYGGGATTLTFTGGAYVPYFGH